MADDASHDRDDRQLPAGDFSTWMDEIQGALRGERGSVVPCGSCTACCTASQFVHIGPDEKETLERIPDALLFPAPRLPPGHFVLGYDERGHCPMLIDNQCSIYEHRPQTCRTYDCRIFPAAGLEVDDDGEDKALIARQARRWQFGYPTPEDRTRHEAVRAAAAFLHDHVDLLPEDAVPTNTTQRAVLAVELHDAFLQGPTTVVDPDPDVVRARAKRAARVRRYGTT